MRAVGAGRTPRSFGAGLAVGGLLLAVVAPAVAPSGPTAAAASSGTDRRLPVALADTFPSTTVAGSPIPPVPAEYEGLYAGLAAQLDRYQAAVTAMPTLARGRSAPPVRGVELLDANANRGTALFGPDVLADVSRDINHFHAIGVTGLTLGIKLPFLLRSYTGADAARYLSFYQRVAGMIRAQHMTVDVELSAAFCGTAYSSCTYRLPSTVAGLARITAEQARIVVNRIRPDYLTLISEQTTDATLTRDTTLDTVAGSTRLVSLALGALGPHRGVAVGAGAATWEPPSFNSALLRLPIDYLDLHLYPIGSTEVSNLITDTELAHAAGKPVVADEVWLYKSLTPADDPSASSVSGLNDFSFFAPLDARFASITQQWATKTGVRYDSAFWSWQLFGYQAWTPALDTVGYRQLSLIADATAIGAMGDGQVTATGRAWTGRS